MRSTALMVQICRQYNFLFLNFARLSIPFFSAKRTLHIYIYEMIGRVYRERDREKVSWHCLRRGNELLGPTRERRSRGVPFGEAARDLLGSDISRHQSACACVSLSINAERETEGTATEEETEKINGNLQAC